MKPARAIVFEDNAYQRLLPLVYWRTVGELRCGYHTLLARHSTALASPLTDLWVREEMAGITAERHPLRVNMPTAVDESRSVLLINARYLPGRTARLSRPGTMGLVDDQMAFAHLPGRDAHGLEPRAMYSLGPDDMPFRNLAAAQAPGAMINYPWDLVLHNEKTLREDWPGLPDCQGRVFDGAHLIRPEDIFIGANARIMPGAVLDASIGPIHIGSGVTVSPLAVVQGPAHIGDRTVIQPGAAIRHACSLGPACKLGGEIEATIIQGFSNKQHDGFLGHAWLGEWVNLGADTVNSDLKNTYGAVRVPINGREVDSGQTFVGSFIADHVKTGIGLSLPTGCVIGFGSSVALSTLAPKFVPSFSWITDQGAQRYVPQRCLAVARKVMERRDVTISPAQEQLFLRLPNICARHEAATGR
jgi:UDP-N-acetylglucosamine diphosphorylase/glucosamine-1-phosphate N-acetyltransferase